MGRWFRVGDGCWVAVAVAVAGDFKLPGGGGRDHEHSC